MFPRPYQDLLRLYRDLDTAPAGVSDAALLRAVEAAYWSTNVWSFVEEAFAIIGPACAHRPHLTRRLLRAPIEAIQAGGCEDPDDVVALGVALASKPDPYVPLSAPTTRWLREVLPTLRDEVHEVWAAVLAESDETVEEPRSRPGR